MTAPLEDDVERIAFAIFDAHRNFHAVEDQTPVSDRHFKVSIGLYRAMATAAIAAMEAWRPIEEAPRDGTEILAAIPKWNSPGHYQRVVWWEDSLMAWVDGSADSLGDPYTEEPTHWKPLPVPPIPPHGGE